MVNRSQPPVGSDLERRQYRVVTVIAERLGVRDHVRDIADREESACHKGNRGDREVVFATHDDSSAHRVTPAKIFSFIAATTRCVCPSERCEYRFTICKVLCPSTAARSIDEAPFIAR